MSYGQSTRGCSLSTSLGDDALLVQRLQGEESVSGLFRFDVEAVSSAADHESHDIVGTTASVAVDLVDGTKRHFHGVVVGFEQGGRDARFTEYRIELRPWLWLLSQRHDCRIFQNMSVIDIIKDVFARAGCSDHDFRTSGTYSPRVYCVQYRESDFAFVSRLMEESGIFYFFEHTADRHTLVIADQPSQASDCIEADAFYLGVDPGDQDRDHISRWSSSQRLHTGKYALKDYNFEDPGNALEVSKTTEDAIGENSRFEMYDYHPERYAVSADGDPQAEVKIQEQETAGTRVRGESECRAFVAGHRFTLKEHFNSAFSDQPYMLTQVRHELHQPSPFQNVGGGAQVYRNDFECVPTSLPYRPLRTTVKPQITGPQTAVVVGPSGEEIYVDKYGRIKVQFHWDRVGGKDENSSCWIRVSQAWAGKQWGAAAHPRIDDEVIVEFLEGDPDKPIVTGCVYNAKMMPPYALPANKTQSGLKSRSSKGGSPSNFNELRFEDKKGSEEVYIQAEKNKNVLVKNDRSENVGNNETISIGNDRTENVGNNETITIGSDRTETVGSNETITIGANRTETVQANETVTVNADRTHTVNKNETVTVALMRMHSVGVNEAVTVGGAQEVTVGAQRMLTVGVNQDETIGRNNSISVGNDRSADIGKDDSVKAGKNVTIEAGEQITLKTGEASIVMKKDGTITISGKDITVKASGKTDVKVSKNLTMKAQKILEN